MSKQRRILHVTRRFAHQAWGGAESIIANVSRQQAAGGAKPTVHTTQACSEQAEERLKRVPVVRHPHRYPILGLSKQAAEERDRADGDPFSLPLLKALGQVSPGAIIHTHSRGLVGGSALSAARTRHVPLVATVHANRAGPHPPVRWFEDGKLHWGKALYAILKGHRVLDEADAVLCVTYKDFDATLASLSHDRVFFLPNGVSPTDFAGGKRAEARAALDVADDTFLMGCISRIAPEKNQLLLIDAVAELRNAGRKAKLVLAGPCLDERYRQILTERARDRDVTASVIWRKAVRTESQDHKDLLAALDAFALASPDEPFGIVVLEAWAAGKPVIVSRAGGLKRLVADGVNGLHADPASAQSFAKAATQLITEPELAATLAANAQQTVGDHYTWHALAAEMDNIYARAEEYAAGRWRSTG